MYRYLAIKVTHSNYLTYEILKNRKKACEEMFQRAPSVNRIIYLSQLSLAAFVFNVNNANNGLDQIITEYKRVITNGK